MEFEFDLGADTAASVASEMVEEMALSQDDAHSIATAIKAEVRLLTGVGSPLAPPHAFPPHMANGSKAREGKPLAALGSSPLSPGAQDDVIPANSSGDFDRSDSMRLLYERQQQQQQQQADAQDDLQAADPLQVGDGDDTDLSAPEQNASDGHEHPVLHARQLSRLLSPPREDMAKLPIKDLFTSLLVR